MAAMKLPTNRGDSSPNPVTPARTGTLGAAVGGADAPVSSSPSGANANSNGAAASSVLDGEGEEPGINYFEHHNLKFP